MTELVDTVAARLLAPAGLELNRLARLLGGMLGNTVDEAELYFQNVRAESWVLEDGIVKEGAFSVDGGVGVRAVSGEKTGFAYSVGILNIRQG